MTVFVEDLSLLVGRERRVCDGVDDVFDDTFEIKSLDALAED